MNCPRCGRDISDFEKLCPYCHEIINTTMEFNDYKKDGFIQLKKTSEEEEDQLILKPKEDKVTYFKLSETNIFVVAIVFILIVAVITIFGLRALQMWNNELPQEIFIPAYTSPVTEPTTEPVIKNTVEEVSIKNIYGSWKTKGSEETEGHAIAYLSFAEGGTAQYNYGSLKIEGDFKDFSTEKENIIYIEIDSVITGLYEFDVTGNKNDGYTLVLTNTESNRKIYYVSATAKSYKLDTIENFEKDSRIIGTWKTEDKTRSYVFTDDGRLERQIDNQTMTGVWTSHEKETLEVKYMESSVQTIYLKYSVFEENLIINNTIYYKEKAE